MEVSAQADDPLQLLLKEIDALGVTTEISDEPPAQPSNCASWCDPAVRGRQCELTAVSVLRNWGPFALISV
jgi:hypothetical protein